MAFTLRVKLLPNAIFGSHETHEQLLLLLLCLTAGGLLVAFVVGLPLSLSGQDGPAARAARKEVAALATVVAVPVETYDERFTTVTAERALAEGGVRGAARRQVVDKVAAAVILQSWLDSHRGDAP